MYTVNIKSNIRQFFSDTSYSGEDFWVYLSSSIKIFSPLLEAFPYTVASENT